MSKGKYLMSFKLMSDPLILCHLDLLPGVKLFFKASANISARFTKQAVHDKTTSSKLWITDQKLKI